MLKKIIVWGFFLATIGSLFQACWQKEQKGEGYYSVPFSYQWHEKLYHTSQYIREERPAWIADELLYAYAGGYYAKGGNPTLVNPEHPPLAKYLIGTTIKWFNNAKVIGLVFGVFSLGSFYLLSKEIFGKTHLALIPVIFFGWEKVFRQQLLYVPLLESFYLTFLLLALYFFIKAQKNSRWYWASSIFLGSLWATRPWMASLPLVMAWLAYLLFFKKKLRDFFHWGLSLVVALAVLLASYLKLFFDGWSLYKVLSVQKWILWYHQGHFHHLFTVWPFIYLKRWYVWYGDRAWVEVDQWNPLWPVFVTLALVFSLLVTAKSAGLFKKRLKWLNSSDKTLVLSLWFCLYLGFLSVSNANIRYIYYLLPTAYLLGFQCFKMLLANRKKLKQVD